jgi:single-strand DNA-binding protein
MSDLNSVTLSGRLTRDPEFKTIKDTDILEFSIASSEKYKDDERTVFIDCTVFGTRAEPLSRFLTKGKQISLTGRLRQDNWEKDGQKRSKIHLVVEELLLPPKV